MNGSHALSKIQPQPVEQWSGALRDCAQRVGPALGLPPCVVLGTLRSPPSGLTGMAVALEGSQQRHALIAVLSNADGRAVITRAILQLSAGETPSSRDENDAIGELVNIISGHVKASMREVDATMRLGLPSPTQGDALVSAGQELLTLRVSFGSAPAALVVVVG